MDKEIIIPRKKSVSIFYSVCMFLVTVMFILIVVAYFSEAPWFYADIPIFLVILFILCIPFFALTFWFFFKNIFNDTPLLTINALGIDENMSYHHNMGIIKWDDIEKISVYPGYTGRLGSKGFYYIYITLKHPEDYIKDQKILNRLKKQKATQKYGHIVFTSLYFEKEFTSVCDLMQYYLENHDKL